MRRSCVIVLSVLTPQSTPLPLLALAASPRQTGLLHSTSACHSALPLPLVRRAHCSAACEPCALAALVITVSSVACRAASATSSIDGAD